MGLDTTHDGAPAPTRRQWRTWVSREPVLQGLSYVQLRAELDVDAGTPRARIDVLLAGLWRLAGHDRDAGGVLVACLAPALGVVAARYRRTLGYEEALSVAVAAVWDRVARFDPPASHVAFRLQWLAGRRVHREATSQRDQLRRQQRLGDDTPGPPEGLPVGVLLGEAVAGAVVSRRGAWLVWVTHGQGLTLAEAAGLLGVSYDAAKQCRLRAVRRLRPWLDAGSGPVRDIRSDQRQPRRLPLGGPPVANRAASGEAA